MLLDCLDKHRDVFKSKFSLLPHLKIDWKNITCVLIHLVRFGASFMIVMVFQDMFLILKITLSIQIGHVLSKMKSQIIGIS